MKVVLSRKGFDSSYGGVASPILPDGALVPLPIPHPKGPITYSEIDANGESLGRFVSDLARMPKGEREPAHLDPDLRRNALKRNAGWRPAFGQTGAAQSHLQRQGVGVGDLFLFYGWFREVELFKSRYRYVNKAPDRHVIFGWLVVESIVKAPHKTPLGSWAARHPHVTHDHGPHSTLYIGAPDGGEALPALRSELVLTAPGQPRSNWTLPAWAHPEGRASALTYHKDVGRWSPGADGTRLRSVLRGQEFVWNADDYPEALAWAKSICQSTALDATLRS